MKRLCNRWGGCCDNKGVLALLIILTIWLFVVILFPLVELLLRSLHDENGVWIGLRNFYIFLSTPSFFSTFGNTLSVSLLTALMSTVVGFFFAYGLTRTNIVGKGFFKTIALAPLFTPSIMHGIALIYLFGNQGLITTGFFGVFSGIKIPLYGFWGILIAEFFYVFPKAVIIMTMTLLMADMRLYDVAKTLGAGKIKEFFFITLPEVRFGIMSAFFVTFTLVFTDFGVPKAIGGQFNVLAVDIYKKVIGEQNFSMGATISLILLFPTFLMFLVDRIVSKKKTSVVSSRAKPYKIKSNRFRDAVFLFGNLSISFAVIVMLGVVVFASLVKSWPYDISVSFKNFATFNSVGNDVVQTFSNSIKMAFLSAGIGSVVIFLAAWIVERQKTAPILRKIIGSLSLFPTAIPGTVIGVAFIFFFNRQEFHLFGFSFFNSFSCLYGTIAILVIVNIVHFMPVSFLTATTALKKLDKEFEEVAHSLGVSSWKLFRSVILPITLPALLEMFSYLFVSSITTISALIFLYAPPFKPLAVELVDMEDAGNTSIAASLSVLILLTNVVVRILYLFISKQIRKHSKKWLLED